jgi:hypothetical protein
MAQADSIRAHSDRIDDRAVGVQLYLGKGWRPEFVGALVLKPGKSREHGVLPQINSLLLLDLAQQFEHCVEPLTDLPGGACASVSVVRCGGPSHDSLA